MSRTSLRKLLPLVSTLALILPLLLALAAPVWAQTSRYVAPGGSDTGDCSVNPCATIGYAIGQSVAGDTIQVAPGTYTPAATITVNQSVTIRGPQAGVDPRPSAGTTRTPGSAAEAIVDGGGTLSRIFRITADDVVIDGLEIRNATGDMVDSPSGSGLSNVEFRYNIVRDALGDKGIQLRDIANAVIEYNHVYDIAQDGINLCCGSTGGKIQFNEVHDNSSENAAIYVRGATNTTIQSNLVYDVYDNDGIKMGSKNESDAGSSGGSILNNVVHDTAQDGITVYMSDVTVEGNQVYNSSSENGAIYVAYEVTNIYLGCNHVHDNALDTAKWGDPGGIFLGTAVDAANVTINYNHISDNTPNGLTNKAPALANAENNWWDAADGPSGAGPGSGDAVSTNVDFSTWLTQSPLENCLSIIKTVEPTEVFVGEEAVFTVVVANNCVCDFDDVVVTDEIAAGLTILDVETTKGSASWAGQLVTVDIGTLGGSEAVTITITVRVDAEGTFENVAHSTCTTLGGIEMDSNIVVLNALTAEEEFVPEPGTILLLGSGLAGLAGYAGLRFRRK